MRRNRLTISFVTFVAVGLALTSGLAMADANQNYTDGDLELTEPAEPLHINPTIAGGLTFWNDRTAFETAFPANTLEDFTGTLVPANNVLACGPTISSTSNDGCFAPGGVVDGFEMGVVPPFTPPTEDMVVATPPFLGVDCVTVGPNTFGDSAYIDFDPPVGQMGIMNSNPLAAPTTINIEVFGAGGSLGTTTADATFPPSFWGVSSDEPITRVEFVDSAGSNSDLQCDLQFGLPQTTPVIEVPTLDKAALAGLVLLLVAAGLVAVRRFN